MPLQPFRSLALRNPMWPAFSYTADLPSTTIAIAPFLCCRHSSSSSSPPSSCNLPKLPHTLLPLLPVKSACRVLPRNWALFHSSSSSSSSSSFQRCFCSSFSYPSNTDGESTENRDDADAAISKVEDAREVAFAAELIGRVSKEEAPSSRVTGEGIQNAGSRETAAVATGYVYEGAELLSSHREEEHYQDTLSVPLLLSCKGPESSGAVTSKSHGDDKALTISKAGQERQNDAASSSIGDSPSDASLTAETSEVHGSVQHNALLKRPGTVRNLTERKRGLFSRYAQGRIPDLLTVPGIGPRNMEKLVAKGIEGVAELKQLYVDKFRDSNEKMVEYLRSSIGILHKHHATSIATFIKDTVEKELNSDEKLGPENVINQKKRLTFCIEGNISVGKTTFLQRVTNEAIELRDLVEIVPEPVAKWQDVGPEHFNVLDAFYAEPERYAYTFQNYVFITRLMQEQESRGGVKPLRLMERSVFSDRMVFVRAVHDAKWMNEMEISIYDSWFNPVVSVLPGLVPDGFIYLRATPDTCLQRLQMRKRPEEHGVTLDYLRDLHEKHEQWLFPSSKKTSSGILSVTPPPQLIEPLPPTIQDRVVYLEGDHVHSSIQKIPALILDCDANIDFSRDIEAKAGYARQVGEFFDYVQRMKALEHEAQPVPHNMVSRSLLLPRSNGLFMPDKSVLHPQLTSMDLRH